MWLRILLSLSWAILCFCRVIFEEYVCKRAGGLKVFISGQLQELVKSVASATLGATTEVQPAAGGCFPDQTPRQEKPSQEAIHF